MYQHKALFLKIGESSNYHTNEKKIDQDLQDTVKEIVAGRTITEKPLYVLPEHLRNFLSKLWKNDSSVLNYIYGCDYNMFFMQVIPVVPNKFRPPRVQDSQSFENQTNKFLNRVIARNMELDLKSGITEMVISIMSDIQDNINITVDSSLNSNTEDIMKGVKQLIEKKEGLFRKNLMGKRVNYAARSVILPDPNLETDEVGIPEVFAKKLSYPEPVTQYNASMLMQAVIQGAHNYPGANYIQISSESGDILQDLSSLDLEQRKNLAKTLLSGEQKKVFRHVRDGDVFLVNRQPTLHRPSIMAHRARVFGGQRVIRIHYANCASYNADFDGDEMNLHLPQNEMARSEAYNLMITSKQYISPTSGYPLRGLIQDNISSAVLLTMKDTFLTKGEYQELIYGAIHHLTDKRPVKILPPAIFKPRPLWTGKQVISTICKHLAGNNIGINIDGKARIKGSFFGSDSEEGDVIFRNNELLCGIIDKKHIGAEKESIVHAFYECYGDKIAGQLLTSLCRLLMLFLQMYGFTCGLDDLLLHKNVDKKRRELLNKATQDAESATYKFCKLSEEKKEKELLKQYLAVSLLEEKNSRQLDQVVKKALNDQTKIIIQEAIPDGLSKTFRTNFFAQMTSSGAKGSQVNFSQVVCCLGQQEFEGRRAQPMASGKTLPSFKEFDTSPMSGGFVGSRFITGIKPQEYFFHTMAGRDGLIDTAIKTARSGYLQRCLIKHLENISTQYDRTVRDNFGSVIQFNYGGDSIDTQKHAMMKDFKFLIMSKEIIKEKCNIEEFDKIFASKKGFDPLVFEDYKKIFKKGFDNLSNPNAPLLSKFSPDNHLGVISDNYAKSIEEYVSKNPDNLIGTHISEAEFRKLAHLKYLKSLIEPGEAVGTLAGQGIGEPSTQMTLNTFHFAGLDVAHVTVGIPRLRQLFMIGSVTQPLMTIPLLSDKKTSEKLTSKINQTTYFDILEKVTIKQSSREGSRNYELEVLFNEKLDTFTKKEFQNSFVDFHRNLTYQIRVFLGRRKTSSTKEQAEITEELEESETKNKKKSKKSKSEDSEERRKKNLSDSEEEESDIEEKIKTEDESVSKKVIEGEDVEGDEKKSDDEEEEKERVFKKDLSVSEKNFKLNTHLDEKNKKIVIDCSFGRQSVFFSYLIENATKKTCIRSIKGITKVVLTEKENAYTMNVEGMNFDHIFSLHPKDVDFKNLLSNDVQEIARIYGIEAARTLIVKDAKSVFDMYGIPVNERHIGLIADYMTFLGKYYSCNRHHFNYRPGALHKMSYEQSSKFLIDATVNGESDDVSGPSSRICFGRLTDQGTGSFSLHQPL